MSEASRDELDAASRTLRLPQEGERCVPNE